MNHPYLPLTDDDEKLFQQHSKGIQKAVRATFPSIPADFELKPETIRTVIGCGIFYDFKIALPDIQYANVSFHSGGHPIQRAPGQKEPEQIFNVDPIPSSSAT